MPEVISKQEIINFGDGSSQIIDTWPLKIDVPDPPDPEPETKKATVETDLNVRETPNGTLVERAGLKQAEVIDVAAEYVDLLGYRWRRIEGDHKFVGKWAAEAPINAPGVPDYARRYMSIAGVDYGGGGTDEAIVQPSLSPIIEVIKNGGASKTYWFKQGSQVRQHIGGNGRKFPVIDRAPEIVRNGAKRSDLIKQLDKMNKRPYGSNDVPLQMTLVRSLALHESLTLEENIQAWREFLADLNQRVEGGEPLLRVVCCLYDALGDSNMIIPILRPHHTGEYGHLQPEFWHDENAIQIYIDYVTEFVTRAFDGYWHLISVIELFNEAQLPKHKRVDGKWTKEPIKLADAIKFREQSYRLSKIVFEATGRRIPISLGTRLMSDVTPQGVAEIDWIRTFFKDPRANYLHALTVHIAPEKNATSPTQIWSGHASAMNAKMVADETKRVFYIGEFWTWFPAEDVSHGDGWGRVEQATWFCNFWYLEQNIWGALVYPIWFHNQDMNTGDRNGGLDYFFDPVGTPNVAHVYYTMGANVLWQRRHIA